MKNLSFRVNLLSDVVVTANAATTGGHQGLDFIPGSAFMGAAVSRSLSSGAPFAADLFLSGRLRFLDAWPCIGDEPAFPIPLSFHKVKGEEWKQHPPLIPDFGSAGQADDRQPQQWRGGYMTASGTVLELRRNTRMKSAIDRTARRSAEGQLFGYEAILAGQDFFVRVQADRDEDADAVAAWFAGQTLGIGRSRSAEYGRVHLSNPVPEVAVQPAPDSSDQKRVSLYLASDLALFCDGHPVLKPKPEDFVLPSDACLVPGRTFVRVRSYSPWNAFYNCRMTERQVLVKGSVITFELPGPADLNLLKKLQDGLSHGVGAFREEGLGQIWVNSPFLIAPPALQPVAVPVAKLPVGQHVTALDKYLDGKARRHRQAADAFNTGLSWAEGWLKLSKAIQRDGQSVPGKSQWANIRELVVRHQDDPARLKKTIEDFCGSGLRKKIWKDAALRERNLMKAVLEKLAPPAPGYAALALYHACVEMGRKLSDADRKQGGQS